MPQHFSLHVGHIQSHLKMQQLGILPVTAVVACFLSSVKAFDNTSESARLACPVPEFACENAYRCIGKLEMCNGRNACGDNSDEDLTNCILYGAVAAQLTCAPGEFPCRNGFRCVPGRYLCDDDNDCKDNSDEDPLECIRAGIYDDHVTCADIGFMCGAGAGPCISRKLLCNGKNDCGDNTDEDVTNCRAEGVVPDELRCQDGQFRCKNEFLCIAKALMCDNDNDCFDGSDEDPVECAKEGLLPDGTTCADMGFECTNTTFDGSFCIGNLYICDGKDNCGDNSDEDPEICEHRSDKPTLEILPWYEPPEPNSRVGRRCGNNQFSCGVSCLSKKYLCDSKLDCRDGSDEDPVVCLNRTRAHKCMSHEFQCNNGTKCIPKRYVCDGDNDCGDMSDEDPRSCNLTFRTTTTASLFQSQSVSSSSRKRPLICRRDQFKCLNGEKCIRRTSVCDRDAHCGDRSDETPEACRLMGITHTTRLPPNPSCGYGTFFCRNRKCIRLSYVCDGDNDCGDYSDESPPYCNRTRAAVTPISPQRLRCRDGLFQCTTLPHVAICLPRLQVCNGMAECPLGDDEYPELCRNSTVTLHTTPRTAYHTTSVSCATDKFLCADRHKCIPSAYVCDASNDCDDRSDEDPSICIRSSSQSPLENDLPRDSKISMDSGHHGVLITFAVVVAIALAVIAVIVIKRYRSGRAGHRLFV